MNYKDLQARISQKKQGLAEQLDYLVELRQRCRDGIAQEKVSAKEGVMVVVEAYPALELQATKAIIDLVKHADQQAKGAQDSQGFNVTIVVQETNDID